MKNAILMMGLLGVSIAAATSLPLPAHGQASQTAAGATLSKGDQEIVAGMARANMAEIEAGKLAMTKAEAAEVKAYAQRMVDDHTKALGDVSALAQAKGITLPTDLDPKHKAMASKLSKLNGKAFDKQYMAQAGVADHKQVHAKLKQDEAKASDPAVKALAAKLLPTVEQHLNAATAHKH